MFVGSVSSALCGPRADRIPPEALLRVASDEAIVFRFGRAVPPSLVGTGTIRIGMADGGQPAGGRFVAGTFFVRPETGRTAVVNPDVLREYAETARGLDRAAATALVERELKRFVRTGRTPSIESSLRHSFGGRSAFLDPRDGPNQRTPNAADVPLSSVRRLVAGDDALWQAHLAGSATAFAELAADPRAERFVHTVDPVTGKARLESDLRRREHRRVLFGGSASRRTYTFVPEVPESEALQDIAYESNTRYTISLRPPLPRPLGALLTPSGSAMAVRGGRATFETTDPGHQYPPNLGTPLASPLFELSELGRGSPQVVDVTPPYGETFVDPTTDWEDPQDRRTVADGERRPFVIRFRFDAPLDPRTATTANFSLHATRAHVGTPDETRVDLPVALRAVRLEQSRLGKVELTLVPWRAPDPRTTYAVTAKGLVKRLDGELMNADWKSEFTTDPHGEVATRGLDESFDGEFIPWYEPGAQRQLTRASAERDPDGRGLFVPFLGDDPVPVTAIQTPWYEDSGADTPRFVLRADDPATPEVDGTSLSAPPGSSTRVFLRVAPADARDGGSPNIFRQTDWIEMTPGVPIPGARYFHVRVEFTLPPGATPDSPDLPSIDRLTIDVLQP